MGSMCCVGPQVVVNCINEQISNTQFASCGVWSASLHVPPIPSCSSRLWREAVGDALSPRPELWSHPVIDHGFGTAVRVVCSQKQSHLKLKLPEQNGAGKDNATISPCEDFDWSLEDASPFLVNLRELSLGNVSPETATMVAYLRSNVVSPVEVEMDIAQATAGMHTSTYQHAWTHMWRTTQTHAQICIKYTVQYSVATHASA